MPSYNFAFSIVPGLPVVALTINKDSVHSIPVSDTITDTISKSTGSVQSSEMNGSSMAVSKNLFKRTSEITKHNLFRGDTILYLFSCYI